MLNPLENLDTKGVFLYAYILYCITKGQRRPYTKIPTITRVNTTFGKSPSFTSKDREVTDSITTDTTIKSYHNRLKIIGNGN